MPMRLGEMVLIIRTQDYASRNLNRLSQNLGKLSTMQRLQRQQATQQLRQARILSRMDTAKSDLSMLQRRVALENQIMDIAQRRSQEARRLRNLQSRTTATGMLQGAGGRFIGKAAPHLAAASGEIARLAAAEKALQVEHGQLMAELQATRPALARMGTDAAAARIARLTTELRLLDRELRIVQGDLAVTGAAMSKMRFESIHRAGQSLSRFGRIAQLTGLITTGAFVAMGNKAAEFSASATLAATQARNLGGDTADALSKSKIIQAAVIEQMQKYPIAAQDMTNATYEIFSSLDLMNNKGVVNTTKGLKILDLANRAAVAGGVDLAGSIQGIIITLNNFDPGLKNVSGTLNTMFDIVRFGNIHFSDLTTVLGKVAPAAKSVGFSLEDVAGALAQATRTLPSGMVAAGFSQLMRVFADPNFQEGIRVASKLRLGKVIDIAPAGKLEKPLEILRDILQIFPELARGGKETASFFRDVTKAGKFALTGRQTEGREFTIQIRRVFEALIQNFGSVEELQAAILANNGELGKSFATMMQDPGVQWKLFLSQLQAFVLIVGQAALPALLQLADGIQRVLRWFQNLNPHTRNLIIKLAVFAGAVTLVIGVLGSLAGAVLQVYSFLRLLGIGLAAATGWGAIIALSAMAAMMIVTHWTEVRAFFKAWQEDVKSGFVNMWHTIEADGLHVVGTFARIMGKLTGAPAVEDWGKRMQDNANNMLKQGDTFTKNYNKWKKKFQQQDKKSPIVGSEKWSTILSKALDTSKTRAATKAWNDYLQTIGLMGGAHTKAAQAAKDHAQAVKQASANMDKAVTQAANNLANTYDELRQQNEAAMKGIFQGPTMTGLFGNIFSGINDTLRQFGIQIPVPFAILKQDMDQSFTYFKRWRADIAKLLKAGVPIEMVQQIQAMGPDAGISIAEGFLSGGKAGRKSLIKEWKAGQKLIDQVTATDMKNKLKLWNSYGKEAAWATINGIISNPRNFKITKMYESYVKSTYAPILKKTFQDDVATYMKNAIAIAKASAGNLPKTLFGPTGPGGTTTGKGPGGKTTTTGMLPFVTPQQVRATRRAISSRGLAAAALSRWAVDPRSPGGELITGPEQRAIEKLRRQQRALQPKLRRQRAALRTERKSIMAQLMAQSHGVRTYGGGGQEFHVTYGGDTVTIHADGATPAAVNRALTKLAHKKKNKHRNRGTVKP